MRTFLRANTLALCLLFFHLYSFSQQVAKTIPNSTTPEGLIGFLEFKPSDYGSQKHPLIIFLHGIGERGNGTSQIAYVKNNAIPKFCGAGATMRFTVGGQTSSFVVLSPQLSIQYGYWPTFYVKEMIKYAKANLQIDPNRIYVTGLSLGGGGIWRLITDTENFDNSFDGTIAAAAPVCGTQEEQDGNFCNTIGTNHLPIWAFHSMDDGTVNVAATQHAEVLTSQCGNITPSPIFTYYQSGGHGGAWDNAYDTGHITRTVNVNGRQTNFTANPNMYEWFLSNTRSTTQTYYTAPVANAGAAQIITLPVSTVTLTGSGTGTNGSTISSYSWTKTSGPSGGIVSLPLANTTLVTGLVQGTYVFTLTVTNNHGLSNSSSVTVTVNPLVNIFNQAPLANAGKNATITLPASSFTLDGSGSADPDGSITAYEWTQMSGTSLNINNRLAAVTGVTGLVAGTYNFILKVTDNNGAISYSSVTIIVNQGPLANAGSGSSITLPKNTITLDGSASSDPDGYLVAYEWTQTSGATATVANRLAAVTSVTGLVAGNYNFVLKVTDNNGAASYSSVAITVNPAPVVPSFTANQSPTANAGSNSTVTLPTSSFTLDGSGSTDTDGWLTGYEWTQMSGTWLNVSNRLASVTTVTGLVAGTYNFVLKVTDNGGAISFSTVVVTINAAPASAPNQSPVANAGANVNVSLPLNSFALDGSGSFDPDGWITGYEWTQMSGPALTLGNRLAAVTTVSGFTAGSYNFILKVTDNSGAIAYATVVVTVNAAPFSGDNQPIGYVKQMLGLWQACDDVSSDGRTPIYASSIDNGNIVYLDAGLTQVYNGGFNWFSFAPVVGQAATIGFSIFPDGVIHLMKICSGNAAPAPVTPAPPAAPTAGNLLGYIKISTGPYQACDDASSNGRIPVYGTNIANGSYLYSDAAMTQIYNGDWNWFSFTPVLGGSVTYAFAIYPIGSIGLLKACSNDTRVAATALNKVDAVSLQNTAEAAVSATAFKLNIYPNPVSTAATIQLNSADNGVKIINLYNASGVLAASYRWQTIKGNNSFSIKNLSVLSGGLYIADIRDSNGKSVGNLKFIKQ